MSKHLLNFCLPRRDIILSEPIDVGFGVDVHWGDALSFKADVLAVKDWRNRSGGLDAVLYRNVRQADIDMPKLEDNNSHFLVDAKGIAESKYILFVGPSHRQMRSYTHIREFAHDLLRNLKVAYPEAVHVATNIQGTNRGFDEREALRSMLLGFNDAYEAGDYPSNLKHITFVEMATGRADIMKSALNEFLPETATVDNVEETVKEVANVLSGQASFAVEAQRPEADEKTPHIFVAMPFSEVYDDQYYLAIYPAVQSLGYLCIRLDQKDSAFTGNIIDEIKERIGSASLMVALLDSLNPNVFLEIGYAWGRDIPTILIIHEDEKVPFDVSTEKLTLYKRIYQLKEELVEQLSATLG